jgi:hypothetical protein
MFMLPHCCMHGSDRTSMLGRVWGCVHYAEQSCGVHRKVTETLGAAIFFTFI